VDIYCTRPNCAKPVNSFPDLDAGKTIKTVSQKFCLNCGMPLILAGRYLVEKPLARGGFGATYLARDRLTPGLRKCVVKQLQPIGLTPEQMQIAKQMFEREGEVLELLGRHPQIPDLLAFFEIESNGQEFFYLVQEFIDGFTLEQLVHQHGPLGEEDVLEIMRSLLPVLQFVHDNGSIHRDIKPSNIMIRKSDQVYYLLDFGAVKQVAATRLSQRSTGIYTPGYGAPEQMRGDAVFPSTDLYAFGATCLFLLTGKDPEELMDVHANSWQWRKFVQVSAKLGEVLDKMIAFAPKDRFSSAQEILDILGGGSPSVSQVNQPKATVITPSQPQPTSTATAIEPQVSVVSAPAPPPLPVQPKAAVPKAKPWLLRVPLPNQMIAAFLFGFQGGLLGVVAHYVILQALGVLPAVLIVGGIMLAVLALRSSGILDNKDMVVFVNILSILLVLGLQFFFKWNLPNVGVIALISAIAGCATVAVMTLFRLLFNIIYSIL